MANGKITVGTIQDTDGNTIASTYVTNGVAKAWGYFATYDNPPNIDGSFAISSITDVVSGEVQVSLTNVMSDMYYCPLAGGGGTATDNTTNPSNRNLAVCVMTTTKVDSEVYNTANAQSTSQCHIAVLGDLA